VSAVICSNAVAVVTVEVDKVLVFEDCIYLREVMGNKEVLGSIGYDTQYTKNLGNYESAKVGISVTMPTTEESLDENFDFVRLWADEKMDELVSELESK